MRWKRHKFNAKKVTLDGYVFDSLAEAARYKELKLLIYAGEISILKIHPPYAIEINGTYICSVEMDFEYVDKDGGLVVEDIKGKVTDLSSLKRKLYNASYPTPVTIIKA